MGIASRKTRIRKRPPACTEFRNKQETKCVGRVSVSVHKRPRYPPIAHNGGEVEQQKFKTSCLLAAHLCRPVAGSRQHGGADSEQNRWCPWQTAGKRTKDRNRIRTYSIHPCVHVEGVGGGRYYMNHYAGTPKITSGEHHTHQKAQCREGSRVLLPQMKHSFRGW